MHTQARFYVLISTLVLAGWSWPCCGRAPRVRD